MAGFDINIDGLDDAQNRLDEMQQGAESIDSENTLSFQELFNPSFMRKHTDYDDIQTFVDESQFTADDIAEWGEDPPEEWHAYVAENTLFSDYDAMLQKAANEWALSEMGF